MTDTVGAAAYKAAPRPEQKETRKIAHFRCPSLGSSIQRT
jgi:hypothetical protein